MSILWYVALMVFGGLLFGRLAKLVRLPNVTGYLIAGLILGPYVLRLIPSDIVSQMDVIADVALGFIAFSVGSEFKMSYIRRVGMTPIVIACLEALGATVLVTGTLILCGQDLAFSIMLGAIAAATAPAATIMVIRQYKAKGPLTETLMTVVALDDAAALMLFGISNAIAQQITAGGGNVWKSILQPVYEIGGSLVLGAALGLVFLLPLRFFKKPGNRLSIVIGMVFLAVALADFAGFSALLVCMMMGAMFVNFSSQSANVMTITDGFTPPILMLFFVLSGAELNIGLLPQLGLVGVLYVVTRVIGKFLGAFAGSRLMKAPPVVSKFLGFTLIPQAGVAIGLSLVAESVVPEHGAAIRAVVLCATLIYEMIGPVVTKLALKGAGEITEAA